MITKLDIHLLTRVGKIMADLAGDIEASELPWSSDPSSKAAKRNYDRIQREVRDLAALRKRLQTEQAVYVALVAAARRYRVARLAYESLDAPGGDKADEVQFSGEALDEMLEGQP